MVELNPGLSRTSHMQNRGGGVMFTWERAEKQDPRIENPDFVGRYIFW